MAKDFYDKLKIISDTIKEHKILIFMIIGFLSSGMTNLGQLIVAEDNEIIKLATAEKNKILKTAMIDQINVMAGTYVRIKKMIKEKPKVITKTITKQIIKPSNCEAVLRKIITEIDKKDLAHVNKLHR